MSEGYVRVTCGSGAETFHPSAFLKHQKYEFAQEQIKIRFVRDLFAKFTAN